MPLKLLLGRTIMKNDTWPFLFVSCMWNYDLKLLFCKNSGREGRKNNRETIREPQGTLNSFLLFCSDCETEAATELEDGQRRKETQNMHSSFHASLWEGCQRWTVGSSEKWRAVREQESDNHSIGPAPECSGTLFSPQILIMDKCALSITD